MALIFSAVLYMCVCALSMWFKRKLTQVFFKSQSQKQSTQILRFQASSSVHNSSRYRIKVVASTERAVIIF
jgi:hypothetical protein